MVVSDLHCPFHHPDAFRFLRECKKRFRPDLVVGIGDEIDSHTLSLKFPADPDGMSPGHEIEATLMALKEVYRIFPVMKVCVSNHTARVFKKAFSAGIPKAFLKSYREFLEAPMGWEWADHWDIDGVRYMHGEGYTSNSWTKAAQYNQRNTVLGHTHSSPGTYWWNGLWTLNAGCLVDESAYSFAYGKHMKNRPELGLGVVKSGVPQFVPMG